MMKIHYFSLLRQSVLMLVLLMMVACQNDTLIERNNAYFQKKYSDNTKTLSSQQKERHELLKKVEELKQFHQDDRDMDFLFEKEKNRERYLTYLQEHILASDAYFNDALLPTKYMYEIEARPNPYVEAALRNTKGKNTYLGDCRGQQCDQTKPLFYSAKNLERIQIEEHPVNFQNIDIPVSEMSRQRHIMNKDLLFADENEILQENLDFIMVKKEKKAKVLALERQRQLEEEQKNKGAMNKIRNFTSEKASNVKNILSGKK